MQQEAELNTESNHNEMVAANEMAAEEEDNEMVAALIREGQ